MIPYYEDDQCVIFCADSTVERVAEPVAAIVTDPPFGIGYESGKPSGLARRIRGDSDTAARDDVLLLYDDVPALVFGTWRVNRPAGTRAELVWDTKGALGMGALDLPWKPASQRVYAIGRGFVGRRTSDVIVEAPVQSMARNGRSHPHEKPVRLMRRLIEWCPSGTILDPFMGSGPTLRAAKDLGRRAIGIEIEERYCELAVQRLAQEVLPLEEAKD